MKYTLVVLALLLGLAFVQAQEVTLIQPPTTGIQGSFTIPDLWLGFDLLGVLITPRNNVLDFTQCWGTVEGFEVYPEQYRVYLRMGHTTALLSVNDHQLAVFQEWKARHRPPHNLIYVTHRSEGGALYIWLFEPSSHLF
jgi:hypothetical protein